MVAVVALLKPKTINIRRVKTPPNPQKPISDQIHSKRMTFSEYIGTLAERLW
jgi:hypothetical protein